MEPAIQSPTARPIAFTSELVRLIRTGHKTQTRRPIVPPPDLVLCAPGLPLTVRRAGKKVSCRFGGVGDRLWLREKWAPDPRDPRRTIYGADPPAVGVRARFYGGQSMPRARCRMWLEIVSLRVERLHAITPQDAIAEGIPADATDPVSAFATLWDANIVREGARWRDDPWVWVVEFRTIDVA